MINHTYPNGDESQTQNPDPSARIRNSPPLQYIANTRYPQNMDSALHRTAAPRTVLSLSKINNLLQLSEWEVNTPDDELPVSFIWYTIEWKVKAHSSVALAF
ncbi:hypothetical protein N7466_011126 [Penicillium verhagenii]|uniref:uncharacterized protein n=1 Tax=Penicillium verhagenii TaxID=1562060 RepID=UPI002544F9CA|nr:uncharacterized protein N7466_011126 [Penicillium verhagenii]KAJ5917572.1 hypothetical protein N7466_011126 [Penicillium verhagenii]